jgi:hypothetical protein
MPILPNTYLLFPVDLLQLLIRYSTTGELYMEIILCRYSVKRGYHDLGHDYRKTGA